MFLVKLEKVKYLYWIRENIRLLISLKELKKFMDTNGHIFHPEHKGNAPWSLQRFKENAKKVHDEKYDYSF